ncbi:MAG: GAF domain-containing protein [Desulfomicrobium sp.]|jgi:GAF domain-containing protein|nr:GAF domain-containing protein [Desulfomicrobium sp.]
MSQKRYEIIYEVSRTVNSSLDPSEVLSRIAEQVTRAMGGKGCFIRLLDGSGQVLKPAAYYGLSERYAKKGVVEVAKSGLDREAFAGNVVQIADVSTDSRFQYGQEASKEGLTSVLVAPMMVEGTRPIGVLRLYTAEKRDFDAEDMGFLQAIANISAIAIENARMHQTLKRQMELINAYDYQVFED